MTFSFIVGNEERHNIEFLFNPLLGNLYIKMDGKKIVKDFIIFSKSLTRNYSFEIGKKEKHKIKIEKIRKLIFANLRKQTYKVYIDEQLCHEFKGF